jgi:carbonic anhydrase/acetyltransferase-like protein (isoleucine patch superfamily)
MIREFKNKFPNIHPTAYIDDSTVIIGDVIVGKDSSLWPMTVVRGDVQAIKIGKCTNIQDTCVLHVTHDGEFSPGGEPLLVGDSVTVGHRATLHACTVGNLCLIGMSATIMDGAVLEDKIIIGAGSLVPAGKQLESGYLYVGSPAKKIRPINQNEMTFLKYSAEHYVKLKELHKNS